MARMKNSEVVDAYNRGALPISERPTRAILAGVACTRLLRALRPLVEDVGNGQQKLLDECAERDEKNEMISVKPGHVKIREDAVEHFNAEMKKLMEMEVDVDVWVKPGHFEGVEVSGAELAALGPLLRLDEE